MLIRQASLAAKRLHSRIPAEQREFRGIQGATYASGAQTSHAIECFECAILVAQPGEGQGLSESVWSNRGRQFLGFFAPAGASVGIAQVFEIVIGREYPDRLINSSLAQSRPRHTFGGSCLPAMAECLLVPAAVEKRPPGRGLHIR